MNPYIISMTCPVAKILSASEHSHFIHSTFNYMSCQRRVTDVSCARTLSTYMYYMLICSCRCPLFNSLMHAFVTKVSFTSLGLMFWIHFEHLNSGQSLKRHNPRHSATGLCTLPETYISQSYSSDSPSSLLSTPFLESAPKARCLKDSKKYAKRLLP